MNIQSVTVKSVGNPTESTADYREAARGSAADVAGLAGRSEMVAATAASHADVVDRDARFPHEAIDAARSQRLLGIMVPNHFGGEGATIGEVVDVCYRLGRGCASTAMIYAMHQTK